MQKKYRNLLVIALCIFSAFLSAFNYYYFFSKRGVGPIFYVKKLMHVPEDTILSDVRYKALKDNYLQLNLSDLNAPVIVFIGDSITKQFDLHELSQNSGAVNTNIILNRGIFSDTTYGLINRIEDNVNNLNVQSLFLMIGYNDLKYRTNDEIITNIQTILAASKAKHKYIQSLLPVDVQRTNLNDRIIHINERLINLAARHNYVYIDLYSEFRGPDTGISPELTYDGLHPNFQGYKIWFSAITPFLSGM